MKNILRRQLINACFIAAFLIICANAFAAKVSYSVKEGFDKIYRPGVWTPIIIEMDNTGDQKSGSAEANKEISGKFTLSYNTDGENDNVFSRGFTLPQYSKKRFFVYAKFPDNLSMKPSLKMLDGNNKSIASVQLDLKDEQYFKSLILIVTDEMSFSLPQLITKNAYDLVTIPPDELPDLKNGLDSVDMIFITKPPDKTLSNEQKAALLQWIMAGGQLFCIGGSNFSAYQNSFLTEYLPAVPDGINTITPSTGTGFSANMIPVNTLKMTKGKILYSVDNNPLLLLSPVGKGSVFFWASDTSTISGENNRVFRNIFNSVVNFRKINRPDEFFWSNFMKTYNLGNSAAGNPPSLLFITFFIFLYVVIAGPVNFVLLYKRRKVEYAWISTPLIILVFTIMVYILSVSVKGRKYFSWEFTKTTIPPNTNLEINESITGVFSPENIVLDIKPKPEQSMLSQYAEWDTYITSIATDRYNYNIMQTKKIGNKNAKLLSSLLPDQPPIHFLDNNHMDIMHKNIAQWSTDFLKVETIKQSSGNIDGYVNFNNGIATGEIFNNSNSTLKASFVLFENYPVYIGDIEPNKSKSFRYDSWHLMERMERNTDILNALEKQVISAGGKAYQCDDMGFFNSMLDGYINTSNVYKCGTQLWDNEKGRVLFIAMAAETDNLMDYGRDIQVSQKHRIIEMPLRWNKCDGGFRFLKNQMRVDLISIDGKEFQFAGDQGVEFYNDTFIYIMACPPIENCQISVSSVDLNISLGNLSKENIELIVYNFQRDFWDKVELINDLNDQETLTANFENVRDYISPVNGRMFFRIRQLPQTELKYYGNKTLKKFEIQMSGNAFGGN